METKLVKIDEFNLSAATVRRALSTDVSIYSFDVEYRLPEERSSFACFAITDSEIAFIRNSHISFVPWFDDMGRAVRFESSKIRVIPTFPNDGNHAYDIHIRLREMLEVLEQAVALEHWGTLDFTSIARKSFELGKPQLRENVAPGAEEIIRQYPTISPFVNRVRAIATSYSGGQDDPIDLRFTPDWPSNCRSLYWEIRDTRRPKPDNFVMNGGIIWHPDGSEDDGSYSIHT